MKWKITHPIHHVGKGHLRTGVVCLLERNSGINVFYAQTTLFDDDFILFLVIPELRYPEFGVLVFHFINHFKSSGVLETNAVLSKKWCPSSTGRWSNTFILSRITDLLLPSGKVTSLRILAPWYKSILDILWTFYWNLLERKVSLSLYGRWKNCVWEVKNSFFLFTYPLRESQFSNSH